MTNYLQPQSWAWEHAAMAPTDQFQVETEREYMFEKPLTPSDVGKLNRLVIPKQNAEKYFPIIQDQPGGEKGLLLDFEDETGKSWRFRYSYWSSSQSYVLTKGWSRFVKEKRLDAGDTIVFQRHHVGNLLYIRCRRRGQPQDVAAFAGSHAAVARNAVLPWSAPFYSSSASESSFYNSSAAQQHCLAPDNEMGAATESSATTKPVKSRRLRLFGVNFDCGPEL